MTPNFKELKSIKSVAIEELKAEVEDLKAVHAEAHSKLWSKQLFMTGKLADNESSVDGQRDDYSRMSSQMLEESQCLSKLYMDIKSRTKRISLLKRQFEDLAVEVAQLSSQSSLVEYLTEEASAVEGLDVQQHKDSIEARRRQLLEALEAFKGSKTVLATNQQVQTQFATESRKGLLRSVYSIARAKARMKEELKQAQHLCSMSVAVKEARSEEEKEKRETKAFEKIVRETVLNSLLSTCDHNSRGRQILLNRAAASVDVDGSPHVGLRRTRKYDETKRRLKQGLQIELFPTELLDVFNGKRSSKLRKRFQHVAALQTSLVRGMAYLPLLSEDHTFEPQVAPSDALHSTQKSMRSKRDNTLPALTADLEEDDLQLKTQMHGFFQLLFQLLADLSALKGEMHALEFEKSAVQQQLLLNSAFLTLSCQHIDSVGPELTADPSVETRPLNLVFTGKYRQRALQKHCYGIVASCDLSLRDDISQDLKQSLELEASIASDLIRFQEQLQLLTAVSDAVNKPQAQVVATIPISQYSY